MSRPILIVGCGSISQRHLKNLRTLGVEELLVVDPMPGRVATAVGLEGAPCPSLEAGLAREPVATIVCTPPHRHVDIAREALEAGSHVFVEKPLAAALDGVDELIEHAERSRRILFVGYNFRFHPGVRQMKASIDGGEIGSVLALRAEFGQYLPDWRPGRDYRDGYNACASMGGGILLDASHEIDYARWLMGEVVRVTAVTGKLSDLEIDVEDTAAVILRFHSGAIGELHLDSVQRAYARTCKVIGAEGTLVWDFENGLRRFRAGRRGWESLPFAADPNMMYVDEMRHFLACIRGESAPLVTGDDGRWALRIALAARQSAMEGREVLV